MADFVKTHPLGDIDKLVNAHSDPLAPSIILGIGENISTAQLFAKKGAGDKLAKKLRIGTQPSVASVTKDFTALPLSPGQWMLTDHSGDQDFCQRMADKVKGVGYVSDQGDARVCFRVSGDQARDLMSRGCRLDLHPNVTGAGFCAMTTMAQVGVLLHQVDDAPTYDLFVYSGFASAFHDWLTHTAAQFGYRLEKF